MIAVVQRVKRAEVVVENRVVGKIDRGMVIFLGISKDDTGADLDFMANKCANLRIFSDDTGKLNLSVQDKNYEILVISQFTLLGDVRKGFRPNFQRAADAEKAESFYNDFIKRLKSSSIKIESGIFGAMMDITVENDGPVTIIINSERSCKL